MPSPIMPYLVNAVLSDTLLDLKRALFERKRKRLNSPHVVTVYLAINDPYSYLLLQVLKEFQQRFNLEYDFRCVLNRQEDMFPAPRLWDKNAFNDGVYLAGVYELDFPENPNSYSPQLDSQLTAQLLHWELQPGFLEHALSLFAAYWQGDNDKIESLINEKVTGHSECYSHHLHANEQLLKEQGHYLSATLHYGGEWYWGLDRLQYLERRLNNVIKPAQASVKYNLAQSSFCQHMPSTDIENVASQGKNTTPIEMFFSIRSPYSYTGLLRAQELASYYKLPLIVKPVLPMVMRRMQVPKTKKLYISQDVKREAKQCDIEFGLIADPLGKGVERCYALYDYAQSKGKGIEYLIAYAKGVWAQGIRSETDKGLQKIVESAGLSWQEARGYLQDDSWRLWAQNNLADLYGQDLWGVPSFIYQDVKTFGQDRLDLIERAVSNNFQTHLNNSSQQKRKI